MRISRVKIENFRNFKALDVEVGSHLVVGGENKVGKTNFLHALRLVLDPSLPDSSRRLRLEDFWDGAKPLDADTQITISVELADFEDNEKQFAVLSDYSVEHSPMVARLTYAFFPKPDLDHEPSKEADYDFAVYGADRTDNLISPDVRRRLPLDLLPALRDAEADLANWRRSPLRPLLDSLSGELDDETKQSLADAVGEAANAVAETAEVKALGKEISDMLAALAGTTHGVATTLSFSPTDADRLIRTLRIFVDGGLRSISEASLGSTNLIYLALKLLALELEIKEKVRDHGFLAIEEPEAHLHPHVQRRVFRSFLRPRVHLPAGDGEPEPNRTILLTTHSPHIASVTPLQSLVLLRSEETPAHTTARSVIGAGLDQTETDDLERYLDVTCGELLFARGIVLVEGDAEAYLVPTLARLLGHDLDELGISVCSVSGTNFVPYVKLLGDKGLGIPFVIVTDEDPRPTKPCRAHNRVLKIVETMYPEYDYSEETTSLFEEAEEDGIFVTEHTLEVALFRCGRHVSTTATIEQLSTNSKARERAKGWREDVEVPRGVACVTYSNECARELKRRLARIGIRPTRHAFVGTVHSFCFQNVVVPFANLSGMDIAQPIRVATDAEQSKCFANALSTAVSTDENPSRWNIRCSNYRRKFVDRRDPAWNTSDNQAARVIEQYETNLRTKGLIDFDDMMLLGLRLIEDHEWVRKALHAKFPVLVVDEYQDLGVPLHRLVLSLCFPKDGPSTRLFAVGDPDQSIYGFVGAEPELLRNLSKRLDVESVTLRLNYRSRQYIISASEIALGEERGYKSVNEDVGTIDFHHCKDGLKHQAAYIADTLIPQVLESGIAKSLGEIAVLYRTKGEGDVVAEEVSDRKFEFVRIDGNSAYPKTPLTRWLEECAAWCSAVESGDAPSLRSIINEFLAFNRTLKSEAARIDATHTLVAALREHRDGTIPLSKWLSSLVDPCLRPHLTADPTMQQELAILNEIITNAAEGEKLSDWSVAHFGGQGGSPDHLNLMTLHSSKGLEFDVVILFGMDQGIIPSYREKSPESKREPKRLFYVGLTRARHEVYVTYSGWRTTPWGARCNDGPSEFIVELANKLQDQDNE